MPAEAISPENQSMINTEEFAALARISPNTARYWRHFNKGPRYFHIGKRVFYTMPLS